jgi:hypothetical protein
MNLSARNVPNNAKLQQKCREYENQVQLMKQNVRKAEAKVSAKSERDDLFSGARVSLKLYKLNINMW